MGFDGVLLVVGLICLLALALPIGLLAIVARGSAEGCFVLVLGLLVMIPFVALLMTLLL